MSSERQANTCERHHFVWTWPIEGGSGSIGVCDLCGAVTTGERDEMVRAKAWEQGRRHGEQNFISCPDDNPHQPLTDALARAREERCCPGHGSMAHTRGCHKHPEAGR